MSISVVGRHPAPVKGFCGPSAESKMSTWLVRACQRAPKTFNPFAYRESWIPSSNLAALCSHLPDAKGKTLAVATSEEKKWQRFALSGGFFYFFFKVFIFCTICCKVCFLKNKITETLLGSYVFYVVFQSAPKKLTHFFFFFYKLFPTMLI